MLFLWFERDLDKTAFAVPANGTFGNAGHGIIEGPGYMILNLGLSKSVNFERFGRVQAIASFQNILNHTNFGEPNMTVDASSGGVITSTHIFPAAGSPRTGEVGLRWSF